MATINKSAEALVEALTAKQKALGSSEAGGLDTKKKNAILYAYMAILTAVHVSLLSTQTNSKELNTCESEMSKANNTQNKIDFIAINADGKIMVNTVHTVNKSMFKWHHYAVTYQGHPVPFPAGSTVLASAPHRSYMFTPGGGANPHYTYVGVVKTNVQVVSWHEKTPGETDLQKIQINNQQVEKERQYFSNKMIVFQQTGQVLQTNIGSKGDYMAQFIQEGTNLTTILSTLANQLAQMLRSP